MLCAGSTVFNALSQSGLAPGDTVAIQGLGGLGHMAIAFAAKMGYRIIAVSRGTGKEVKARELGAHHFVDSTDQDAGEAIKKLGGAKVALTTALAPDAITPLLKGLGPMGKLVIASLPGEVTIDPLTMIVRGASVQAWPISNASESEKAVEFAQMHGLRCEIETFSLDEAQRAYGTFSGLSLFWCLSITFVVFNLTPLSNCRQDDGRIGPIPCRDQDGLSLGFITGVRSDERSEICSSITFDLLVAVNRVFFRVYSHTYQEIQFPSLPHLARLS